MSRDLNRGLVDSGEPADETKKRPATGELSDTEKAKKLDEKAENKASVETNRLRQIETTQTDSDPQYLDDDEPMIPDGAFISAPSPDTPVPITYAAPGPERETSPYQGDNTMPFGEDDEIRGWTTGLGEQEGEASGRETTPKGE